MELSIYFMNQDKYPKNGGFQSKHPAFQHRVSKDQSVQTFSSTSLIPLQNQNTCEIYQLLRHLLADFVVREILAEKEDS